MKSSRESSPTDFAEARLMKVATIAKRLNNSMSTIYALIERGELEHFRCPGIRVSEEQLARYLESSRRGRREEAPNKPCTRSTKLNHIRLA